MATLFYSFPVLIFWFVLEPLRLPADQAKMNSPSADESTKPAVSLFRPMRYVKLRVHRAGSETAHHEIDIEVRNPNPPVTNVYEQVPDPR